MSQILERPGASTLGEPVVDTGVIDLDVHPNPPAGQLEKYLAPRWREYEAAYGTRTTTGMALNDFPPLVGNGQRADLWGPQGEYPASTLEQIQTRLLDEHNVQLGALQCLAHTGALLQHEFAAARAAAINMWQLEHLVYPEPRLRIAMTVPYEAPDLAVQEIERIGADAGVVGVSVLSKTMEPLGRRKYWPIWSAVNDLDLPVLIHLTSGGGHANTSTGWTSFHPEYHVAHVQTFHAQITSLIVEGVFDRYPRLRFVMVEGGVAAHAAYFQRFDHHFDNLRGEVPDLQRRPSEYIHDHLYFATQPVEEPRIARHLEEMIHELGEDNVVFSTDFPHFDFDSPTDSLPQTISGELREKILRGNAKRLFSLAGAAND